MEEDVRVLIIDDSEAIRAFVTQALADRGGYLVREARHGAEGLEMALAELPELILLDLEMPRMDGFHMLGVIRDAIGSSETEVIVVSALSESDILDHGGVPDDVVFFSKRG